jgi:hypothetical protein
MTDQEKEIFYRLLVDLFIDNPKRKQPQVQEGLRTDEKVSSRETKRSRTRPYQATQDK